MHQRRRSNILSKVAGHLVKKGGAELYLRGYRENPDMPAAAAKKYQAERAARDRKVLAKLGPWPKKEDFTTQPSTLGRLFGKKPQLDRDAYRTAFKERHDKAVAHLDSTKDRSRGEDPGQYAKRRSTGSWGGKGLHMLHDPRMEGVLTDKVYGRKPVARNLTADQVRRALSKIPDARLQEMGLNRADAEKVLSNKKAKLFRLELA